MKYASTTPRGTITATADTEYELAVDGQSVVEITDEQADQVLDSSQPLCFVDGALVPLKTKLWTEDPELIKEAIRPERDQLLADSDWTQLNDSSLSEDKRAAWAAYRQALRDITDNVDENGEVEFPIAP
jgi:hypothetical protein